MGSHLRSGSKETNVLLSVFLHLSTIWQIYRKFHLLRGVEANVLNCDIVVCEFELHSRNLVYFQANTLEKSKKLFIFLVLSQIVSVPIFYKDGFSIK